MVYGISKNAENLYIIDVTYFKSSHIVKGLQ